MSFFQVQNTPCSPTLPQVDKIPFLRTLHSFLIPTIQITMGLRHDMLLLCQCMHWLLKNIWSILDIRWERKINGVAPGLINNNTTQETPFYPSKGTKWWVFWCLEGKVHSVHKILISKCIHTIWSCVSSPSLTNITNLFLSLAKSNWSWLN